MPKASRYIEQDNSLQEQRDEALRVRDGGPIAGVEGGLRLDVFGHDDPEDLQCICDLPENAQSYIIQDIDYQDSNA